MRCRSVKQESRDRINQESRLGSGLFQELSVGFAAALSGIIQHAVDALVLECDLQLEH